MARSLRIAPAILLTVWMLTGCGTTEQAAQQDADEGQPAFSAGRYVVAAYHPWWTRSAWDSYEASTYEEVYFFSVEIDSTGAISERNGWPDRWFDMQRLLTNRGIRVTPVVTLFSQRAFETIFASAERVEDLQNTLLELLRDSPNAGGLQIDFEIYQPVSDSVRSGYTQFVRDLRAAMSEVRPDLVLSAYVVAYDESDVFDEAALAESVDYLVVQGYDLHSRREGHTGPVAALEGWGRRNWKAIVNRLLELGVPGDKIVMSVPYFGYEWPSESSEPGAPTRGAGMTVGFAPVDSTRVPQAPPSALERAREHGAQRDSPSGSPYYVYEDSTGWRQGWYEDHESLTAKYRYVKEQGLRGVAVFPAAYGNEELARALKRAFSPAFQGASQ